MTTAPVSAPVSAPTGPPVTASGAAPPSHLRFHDVLSALNPLQYLPVVGTIYRAMTGDTIPEALRIGGSMLVSGLLGGPVGLITNIATTIAERVTGIDPERIAHTVLAGLGLAAADPAAVPATAPATAPAPAPVVATAAPVPAAGSPAPLAAGWTAADLTGEGVTFAADGTPGLRGLSGADALNQVELGRVHVAVAAYARTAALAG